MNKWFELLIGLILVIVPIVIAVSFLDWGIATIHFLMGGLIFVLILIGILFVVLGISDVKG